MNFVVFLGVCVIFWLPHVLFESFLVLRCVNAYVANYCNI